MKYARRVDENHSAILAALRKAGIPYHDMSASG